MKDEEIQNFEDNNYSMIPNSWYLPVMNSQVSVSSKASAKEEGYSKALLRTLSYADIKFLRYLSVDCGNNRRCKAVPVDHLRRKGDIMDHPVAIAEVSLGGLPTYADQVLPDTGLDARFSLTLRPDLSTLRVLPYASQSALTLVNLYDPRTKKTSDLCCRSILERVIMYAAETHGIAFNLGAEIEFTLFDATTGNPVDATTFCDTVLLNKQQDFVSDLYDQLKSQDIEVELVHSESAHGQMEIVLAYQLDAMILADNVVLAQETIKQVARNRGLKALLLPKIDPMQAGSGCHLHISFRDFESGKDRFSQPVSPNSQHSPIEFTWGRSFMEGILQHLPALLALTLPSVNSFRRVGPGCWTGSSVSWAFEDKETPIRVVGNGLVWNHFEYKLCDSMANIHLALAGILRAGLEGLDKDLQLRPAYHQGGELEPLPPTLVESLNRLEADELMITLLPPKLMKAYLAVRRAEANRAETMSLEDEVAESLAKA